MDIIAKVTLTSDTGLAADAVTNTFSFTNVPDIANGTLDAISEALQGFYRVVPSGGLAPLADYLSPTLSNATLGASIDMYDATGKLAQNVVTGKMPLLGSPKFEEKFTLQAPAPAGVTPLPSEVAYVLTLETGDRADAPVEVDDAGDFGGERDRPKQRHTGRIFIGPLNSLAITTTNGVARPSTALRDTSRLALEDLKELAALNAGGSDLAVWSRKDGIMRPVEFVSQDDSFDTQRRRGEKPSVRIRTAI
jgi:hypothetical protein